MLGVSERRACKVLGQPRSTQRYEPVAAACEQELTAAIVELASQYGRYGYRRIGALLRRRGWAVNHFSADGAEDRVTMEGVTSIEPSVAFTRNHFCNELLPALRSLGYDELVDDLDEAEVAEAAEESMINLEALASAGP